ncbi:uncharacterized protein LOC107843216 isoform X3 [Capsicum annuum]|uniref:uncharacterized protein LOC107843216 isoform X3 n=1 Tax=Capsicum annuum TaxID=4072 RepID=UPI001FB06139|nr:uncharacterized protein LOC107843216 isoform X3 [Capsicum annuum]
MVRITVAASVCEFSVSAAEAESASLEASSRSKLGSPCWKFLAWVIINNGAQKAPAYKSMPEKRKFCKMIWLSTNDTLSIIPTRTSSLHQKETSNKRLFLK